MNIYKGAFIGSGFVRGVGGGEVTQERGDTQGSKIGGGRKTPEETDSAEEIENSKSNSGTKRKHRQQQSKESVTTEWA